MRVTPPRSTTIASAAVLASVLAGVGLVCQACSTTTSVIEIPPCADRVEVVGQASRLSPTRFELDHTFELPLTKSVVTFQAGAHRETVELVSTQPDPLRLFTGALAGVAGGFLLSAASSELAHGGSILAERPLLEVVAGSALVGAGLVAAGTGWHPPQGYVAFPEACTDDVAPPITR